MTKIAVAKDALERIRLATNARAPADPADVETLIGFFGDADKVLLGAVDLLAQSRNAFRSKQVERARKLIEEIL